MSPLIVFRDGPIAIFTLADPSTRNALSPELTEALVEACEAVNADLQVRCVILAAEGPAFCSGGNIKRMYAREGHFEGGPAQSRRHYLHGVQRLTRALYHLEAPIIAAVQGPAIGAGFDIALMCDLRLCSNRARFAESFIRLGLVSAAGGAWFLQRQLGPALAAELTLTGREIDAERALALGLVSRIVAEDDLLAAAKALALEIAAHPPHSIRLNKKLLHDSARLDFDAALELAASLQGIVQHTADQHEAVAAVIEKRPPVFTGR